MNSPGSTNENKAKMTKQLHRLRNWSLQDEVMKRTMKLLKYISTDYFVVILDTEKTQEYVRFKCNCNQLFMVI